MEQKRINITIERGRELQQFAPQGRETEVAFYFILIGQFFLCVFLLYFHISGYYFKSFTFPISKYASEKA